MQKLGLTAAERRAFHRALRSSHTRRIYITITDLDGHVVSDLSHVVLDGQVTVDYDAEVTRALNLTVLDPAHTLNFDTESPDDGALFADRMIRVHYSVLVNELGRRVSVPVFHGPVTKLARAGDTVEIEAQGKESLAMGAVWKPLVLKKGMKKTTAIRTLLRERAGERRFSIPDLAARLPNTLNLDRYSSAWKNARKIARSMDRQLFYNGAGRAELRRLPGKPVYTFRTGTGGDIVTDVQVEYLLEDIKNTIVVLGKKDGKSRVRAQAVADPKHPLSPRRLGRTNSQGEFVPRHLVEVIEDESIRSQKEADRKARRILADRLRQTVEVTFDTLPIPHLEPGDLVRVTTDDISVEFRLRQFVIPLGVSGEPTMSIGYHRKTTINRRRIRR
jgi:hypothetical protein